MRSFTVLLLLLVCEQTLSIKCYKCGPAKAGNITCKTPRKENCEANVEGCFLIKYVDVDGKIPGVYKTCATPGSPVGCNRQGKNALCVCNGNLCNSADVPDAIDSAERSTIAFGLFVVLLLGLIC
ncbi:hypothetical protein M3Y98_00662600 [Aphelenchoides besseyi]|nr:hypothetical protein M3Y98_00662600 [Aphelenchoides besseyi]KAI6208811.1 hypothetical protein M3Y96_00154700 [Aphelenchoides besseyi]